MSEQPIGADYCANCHEGREAHMPEDGKCLFGPAQFRPMTTEEYVKLFPAEFDYASYDYPYDDWVFDDPMKAEHWSLRNHDEE